MEAKKNLKLIQQVIQYDITYYYINFYMISKTQVASENQILQFFANQYGNKAKNIYSYYSTDFDRIITQQKYMLIPIDERMATRAHAVFDTIYVKKMKIININSHLVRLINSAKSLAIQISLSIEQMTKKIYDSVQVAYSQYLQMNTNASLIDAVFAIRLNISSGHGDFAIASLGKKPTFYIIVFEPFIKYELQKQGVNQFVVKQVQGNVTQLTHSKTVSYAQNAMMANQSKRLGGYQGIKITKNKIILQASVANVAFVFDGQFATPRFQTVIQGTTIKKCLIKIQQLLKQGKLKKISFRDISVQEAESANQMMVIGGDKIVPVLNFNGRKISEKKGQIAKILQQWYEQTIQQGLLVPFE